MRIGINIGIGRRSGGGGSFRSSHPLLLTRSTAAWAQDLSGNLFAFGVDERRITNAGLTITGPATRLHGEAPTNGGNNGNTTSTLPAEGLFSPLRVVSAGLEFHRRQTPDFSVTSGAPVYIRARVRGGTSGLSVIILRNNTAGTSSEIRGTSGVLSIVIEAAGAITRLVNKILPNGDREFTFTFTPNANGTAVNLGIGPRTVTSGQYIDIIGMQVTSQFSEWIMGGAGTVAQAAEVATLDLTGVSLAAGFMLRMDGTVLATPRVNYDRFYQADTGDNGNRLITSVTPAGPLNLGQFTAFVTQGSIYPSPEITPPVAFSLVGAHGADYVGGAYNGVVATPDTLATYVTPTIMRIGRSSSMTIDWLPILLTRITLFPETPTTPRVTEVSA